MYHKRVNLMHNILLVAVQLGSEEAVWRGSEKYVLLYAEKSLCDKFQQRSSFISLDAVYRPAMLIKMNLFTVIFK